MQKGQVKTRFRLGGRDGAIAETGHLGRVEKEAAMRFKGEGFRRTDDDLGSAVLIRHVDSPRAVLIEEPGVGAHELPALLPLAPSASPPSPAAVRAEDDRGSKDESREDFGTAGGLAQTVAGELRVLVDEGYEDVFGHRMAKGRLHCHSDELAEVGAQAFNFTLYCRKGVKKGVPPSAGGRLWGPVIVQ